MSLFSRLFKKKNKGYSNLYLVTSDVVFNKKVVKGLSFYIKADSKYQAKRLVREGVSILPKTAKKFKGK